MALQAGRRRAAALALAAGGAGVLAVRRAARGPGPADEDLPRVYDPAALRAAWSSHPAKVACRVGEITGQLGPYALRLWLDRYRGKLAEPEVQRRHAADLRERLVALGPAFIKLGQLLSSRPDLLPQPMLNELKKLCDAVPAFPTADAVALLRAELGQDVTSEFQEFDDNIRPIAAASLGQVYLLRLKGSGKEVAVKVQRPDVLQSVSLDLHILHRYGEFVEGVKSQFMRWNVMAERKQFDLNFIECFSSGSYMELDYANEADNQERFRRELEPLCDGKVRIPRVFHHLSARKVLTTEWVRGEKLDSSPPDVIRRLIPVGVDCFLRQLLELGFFHSDPHPGNLLVDENERLCLIDFGLCAHVPLPDTRNLVSALVHLMTNDVPSLLEDAVALGFLPPDVEREALLVDLQRVFDEAKLQGMVFGKHGLSGDFKSVESRRHQFAAVSSNLNQIFFEYPFLVPDYFALITRALIMLEGIALKGDPDFDMFGAAYPYALKRSMKLLSRGELLRIGMAARAAAVSAARDANSSSTKGHGWFGWLHFVDPRRLVA